MKQMHPVAEELVARIRQRFLERKKELRLSDEDLGVKTFGKLGFSDVQKKVNNILNGRKALSVAEFYIMCEGLELPADRLFAVVLDGALKNFSQTATPPAPVKKDTSSPQQEEKLGVA